MSDTLIGASVWEEDLYHHLSTHMASEVDLLTAYQRAANESDSAAFRYLVNLIVEDEKRHHRVFEELANALRSDVEMRPIEPSVPDMAGFGDMPDTVVELTNALLAKEEADAAELRRLSRQLRDVRDTTLWQLLVKIMELDTEKHAEVLRFVRTHAKRSR
jgi:bacterioferritin (cytochrome b1)